MKLSEVLTSKRINVDLKSKDREAVLDELVRLLHLKVPARNAILKTIQAREELGSTGIGRGIAIPHCRSLVVSEVLVAVGRSKKGIPFRSMDRKRAFLFFLIVAPPAGDPGDYLVALGTVTEMARLLAKDGRWKKVKSNREFIKLIKELEE
jgi:mannitol/fructose-specific phosphotransferase system IIA component (Ntr-type)